MKEYSVKYTKQVLNQIDEKVTFNKVHVAEEGSGYN